MARWCTDRQNQHTSVQMSSPRSCNELFPKKPGPTPALYKLSGGTFSPVPSGGEWYRVGLLGPLSRMNLWHSMHKKAEQEHTAVNGELRTASALHKPKLTCQKRDPSLTGWRVVLNTKHSLYLKVMLDFCKIHLDLHPCNKALPYKQTVLCLPCFGTHSPVPACPQL
jgi:hypothetical protein